MIDSLERTGKLGDLPGQREYAGTDHDAGSHRHAAQQGYRASCFALILVLMVLQDFPLSMVSRSRKIMPNSTFSRGSSLKNFSRQIR